MKPYPRYSAKEANCRKELIPWKVTGRCDASKVLLAEMASSVETVLHSLYLVKQGYLFNRP